MGLGLARAKACRDKGGDGETGRRGEGTAGNAGEVVDGIFFQEKFIGLQVVEGFKGDVAQLSGGDDGDLIVVGDGELFFNRADKKVVKFTSGFDVGTSAF